VKLLIDAQLPLLLNTILNELGYNSVHVDSLLNGDESSDSEIINYADEHKLIVTTKDSDFFYSHSLHTKPSKLLLVSTGNIKNKQLLDIFRKNHLQLHELFKTANFVEINSNGVASHE
jgi:predicted nuclease of predicted toxin-antitoxin system